MEGDRADVTSLLNHLENQLQLQDNVIFKLQQEQSARQSWHVRHGSFNDATNNHHPMHASLNASLNENFKNEFLYQEEDSKSEFEEDGGIKSKLSQNNKLKSEFPHNDNLKSEFSHEENGGPCEHNNHDPMCYLQRLIHSQQVARNNYSQQLHNTSLFYYKGMRRKEGVIKECKRVMDENDDLIFDTLRQRNTMKDELTILQKKNQKLKSQIDVFKNASKKELRIKEIISKLLTRRTDVQKELQNHCRDIFTKESKLHETKEKSECLEVNLDGKRNEISNAVGVLEGMFVREMEGQRGDVEGMKEGFKSLEETNLKLIEQVNKIYTKKSHYTSLINASVDSKSPTTATTSYSTTSHHPHPLSSTSTSPTNHTLLDSTNTIKPAPNFHHRNHHSSQNTNKTTQFHRQSPITTIFPTSFISHTSVSIAINTLATTPLATTYLATNTLATVPIATNTISNANTDIQSVIESMQETLLMMEKGFINKSDSNNNNNRNIDNNNMCSSNSHNIKIDKPLQIATNLPKNVATSVTTFYRPIPPSFANTTTKTQHTTATTSIQHTSTSPTTQHTNTPHFPSIFKSSLKPLSIKINSQHTQNDRSPYKPPFNPTTISPNKPHPFSSKPTRLITISSPLKPPTHLLPPTKSSS